MVGGRTGLSLITMLLLAFSLLTTEYYVSRANAACYSSVSSVLVSRFPTLSSYVSLSNYTVVSSSLNYADVEILVFKWASRGVSIEIQAIEETCEIVLFEAVVDSRYINESRLNSLLSKLEAGVRRWFTDTKSLVSNTSDAEVLGGQLVIGNTPVYFLDPNYVTTIPVVVRYFVYPSPPIIIYAFINHFPAVKKQLTHIPNFNLSEEEATETLKNKLNVTEYRGITKSYVILRGVLRPAYVIALTPYKNVAILADNGEVIKQETITNTQETREDSLLTTHLQLVLVLTALAITVTYVVWLKRRHSLISALKPSRTRITLPTKRNRNVGSAT